MLKKKILSVVTTLALAVSAMGISASAEVLEDTSYMYFKYSEAIENGDTAEDIAAKLYGYDKSKINLTIKIYQDGEEKNTIESVDDEYTIEYELKMKDLSDCFDTPAHVGDLIEGLFCMYGRDDIVVSGFGLDEEVTAREYNVDGIEDYEYIDMIKATNDGEDEPVWKEYGDTEVIIHNLTEDLWLENTEETISLIKNYISFNEIQFTITNCPSEYDVEPMTPTIADITSDSGYYADSITGPDKSGIIAFTSVFSNLTTDLKDYTFGAEDKFGIVVYKASDGIKDSSFECTATDFDGLMSANSYFYSFVNDIAEGNFGKSVYAIPYAKIAGTTYWGNIASATVNGSKWLGNKAENSPIK